MATAHHPVLTQLAAWLGQTPRLQEYTAKLAELGCDTPEMLPFLTEAQLREAGVAPLHAQSILSYAKTKDPASSAGAQAEATSEGSNESDLATKLADLRLLYEGLARTGSSERVLSEVRAQMAQMEDELEAEKRSSSRLELLPGKPLGQGQYAVCAAFWSGRGGSQQVAAKRLPLDLDVSREVAALMKCEHPHVVRYYALEQQGSFQYLVMERCEGNLGQMIQSGALQDKQAREQVCLQLCQAVAYIHSDPVGLAHRDIKPENVLYCTDGSVKLCDFGLAKISAQTIQEATLCGTVAWMAPEILEGAEALDLAATDIFSLGCLLHYTLTLGGHPFHRGKQGWGFTRAAVDLSALDPTALHLVQPMIGAGRRPAADWCCAHPLFWPAEKTVELCLLLRESLHNRRSLKALLETALEPVVRCWPQIVAKSAAFGPDQCATMGSTAFHFLVFVRNAACHPGYVVKGGRRGEKEPPFASKQEMCAYFEQTFPGLALVLCEFATGSLADEDAFGDYCLPPPAGGEPGALGEEHTVDEEGLDRCQDALMKIVRQLEAEGADVNDRPALRRQACERALELDTTNAGAWFYLGTEKGGTVHGRHYTAAQCFEVALDLHPDFSAGWYYLGAEGGGAVLGQHVSGKRCLQESLLLQPYTDDAWDKLVTMPGGPDVSGRCYESKLEYLNALRLAGVATLQWTEVSASTRS